MKMIELRPENTSFVYVEIRQRMVERNGEIGCKPNARKYEHELLVLNHCFGIKQRIAVRYSTDSPRARICHEEGVKDCRGGEAEFEMQIACPQGYWKGKRKTVVLELCWIPSKHEKDFNLGVEVDVEPLSAGCSPGDLRDLGGREQLVAYIREGD